jgi:hypothetical protein
VPKADIAKLSELLREAVIGSAELISLSISGEFAEHKKSPDALAGRGRSLRQTWSTDPDGDQGHDKARTHVTAIRFRKK